MDFFIAILKIFGLRFFAEIEIFDNKKRKLYPKIELSKFGFDSTLGLFFYLMLFDQICIYQVRLNNSPN